MEMDNFFIMTNIAGNRSIDMSLTPANIYAIQQFLCVHVRQYKSGRMGPTTFHISLINIIH